MFLLCGCGGLRATLPRYMGMSWVGVPRPVDSRLRGNDGPGIMGIYRIGTMLGHRLGWGTYMDGYG